MVEYRDRTNERGIAMIMVITVLVTLVIVAIAFAPQMQRGRDRTEMNTARQRADREAALQADAIKLWLMRTHPRYEALLQEMAEDPNDPLGNPDVDTLAEIAPGEEFRKLLAEEIKSSWINDPELSVRLEYLKSRGLDPLNDDRGSIWSVRVTDANGLVNVNGCSPYLLANLMGSALLTEEVDSGASSIAVSHVTSAKLPGIAGFDPNGGYIRIGTEVIRYESFDGTEFRGCERGVLREVPLKDNGASANHKKGAPVIDYAAWKIATHMIASRPGFMTRFQNVEDVRSTAGWGTAGDVTAERLAQFRHLLTVSSKRESAEGWLSSQMVVEQLPSNVDGAEPDLVRVRDNFNPQGTTANYNAGTLARVTDGTNTAYAMVANVGDDDGNLIGDREISLAGRVDAGRPEDAPSIRFNGGEAMIAAYAPTPININTAPIEVVYANIVNLQHRLSKEDTQIVTPSKAWELAEEIVRTRKGKLEAVPGTEEGKPWRKSGPFRNAEDWGRFLREMVDQSRLTRTQEYVLYTNAIDPHSHDLKFGTAPWCFRTLDVYHVESRVSVNSRAGEQLASSTLRQVVEVGADQITTWTVDSQADFEQRIQAGSGAKWVASYPFAATFINNAWAHVQPRKRAPKHVVSQIYPSTSDTDRETSNDVGDVRHEPVRVVLPGAVVASHFDFSIYQDGHFTDYEGAYTRKVRGTLRGNDQDYVQPMAMSFWWRCFSEGESWYAFDVGIEKFTNRFAIFVQPGDEGPELTFRCAAGTLEERAAEVYVPLERLDYQPGLWYHIQVFCHGEDPASMQLLVDGLDIATRRGFTTLAAGLDEESVDVQVESTDGFPQVGAIKIGDEIIEYDQRAGESFRECVRATRGTAAGNYPQGMAVRLLGYSLPLTVDLMEGGAGLQDPLTRWSALRVSGDGFDDEEQVQIEGIDPPLYITIRGFNGQNNNPQNVTVAGLWDEDADQAANAFGPKGYALFGSWRIRVGDQQITTADGSPVGGWEVVYYTRDGTNFTIERYQQTAWHEPPENYFCANQVVIPGSEPEDVPCWLIPISVMGSGSSGQEDYLDPSDPAQEDIITRYYPGSDGSARVYLGTDDPEGQGECIKYDSIERKKSAPDILFVRDRNLFESGGIVQHFWGATGDNSQQYSSPSPPSEDDPLPDPEPPAPPDPDPTPDPTPDPGPNPGEPGGEEDEGIPGPGGGVPPGLRDPGDSGDDGGSGDPGTGDPGTGDPGTGDPGTGDPGGGGGGGGSEPPEDGEPVDPPAEEDEEAGGVEGEEPLNPGGSIDPGARGGGDSGGGGGTTPAEPPSEIEPVPDDSGGGDSEEPEEEEEVDPSGAVPPDLRDPEDPEGPGDVEGTGTGGGTAQWNPQYEPAGPETARQRQRMRGVNGTIDRDHLNPGGVNDENARFLPCFKVWEEHSGALLHRAGRNDPITIVASGGEGAPTRYEATVRWGHENGNWMCLTDFTGARVTAPEDGGTNKYFDLRGRARILKFPSGELPDQMPEEMEFGKSTIASSDVVTAFLDELHIWRHGIAPLGFVSDAEGIESGTTDITLSPEFPAETLEEITGYDQDCGVVNIDGELIIYRGTSVEGNGQVILERCLRGQFGTKAQFHPRAAYARFVPNVPVTYLQGDLSKEQAMLTVAHTRNWPAEGAARIVSPDGGEIVHYTQRSEQQLSMPESLDTDDELAGRGLFRGRYGTDALDHPSESVVIWQPIRYWDRYTPRQAEDGEAFSGVYDHAQTSFIELGSRQRNAYWHTVTWEENLDGVRHGEELGERRGGGSEAGLLDIVVLGRFNPNVPWDSRNVIDMRRTASVRSANAMRRTDVLYVFDDPEEANELGFEANTAEFRIYFRYKPNAYVFLDEEGANLGDDEQLTNDWKKTPWLQAFSVSYTNRTRTLSSSKAGRGR
ncbi:MAG: hypothetical protein QNJ98_04200 [Planctomycetota bacterium]|nr:hypothetical protein [Planctomycetota bacterium]